jgi:hypothetical protein
MPVAAIAGIASAGLGLVGSAMGASAANKAADAQAKSAEKSIQFQKDTAVQGRIDSYPWALEGAQAMYMYMDELGIPRPQTPILPDLTQGPLGYNPGAAKPKNQPNSMVNTTSQFIPQGGAHNNGGTGMGRNPNYMAPGTQTAAAPAPNAIGSPNTIPMTAKKGYQESPGYQFQVQQGEQGVLNNLSALGMKNSGKALKSLETFRQGVANQDYGSWLNRIAGVAGMGQSQVNTNNSMAQNTAQNVGQTMQDAGAARASGYVGAANAWSTGLNGVGNALGQMSTNRFPAAPGGGLY